MNQEQDHRLIDAWRHGEISDPDFARLQARLAAEPRLRSLWRKMAAVEEGLSALSPDAAFERAPLHGPFMAINQAVEHNRPIPSGGECGARMAANIAGTACYKHSGL